MLSAIGLMPLLPLLSFVTLALFGRRLGARGIAVAGIVPVGISAILALGLTISFLVSPPLGSAFSQVYWTWFHIGAFAPTIGFYLDPLSLLMILVVTVVGFLILLYSTELMRGDEGYRRFFAYMNLFVASMLILLLANDLLFLLVGWEGVGLCSYLLIGFWYRNPLNGAAARKAFIVTRVGDTSLLVGLLLIFTRLGTLNIQQTMDLASTHWPQGSTIATVAALLILGGAIGKSAQLPLQTWLPDAMAGPTPVSALIHAATMVTAGVYLIARTHVLFDLAPAARLTVAVIGAVTLIYAGLSALAQTDIKRILAYSTISQIGYMFLALGVGAWSAAIFHFMTHAFFKALLFLGAGLVIKALAEEHDIRKMGGLRRKMPLVFWTFLAGAASLSAVPVVTAGYFSKDLIISSTLTSQWGSAWFWAVSVLGAFITSLYAFRLVFVVFFGPVRSEPSGKVPGRAAVIPVVALAVLAIAGGWMQLPAGWGLSAFTDFLQPVLPLPPASGRSWAQGPALLVAVTAVSLLGIYSAYVLYVRRPGWLAGWARRPVSARLTGWALAGWGFDALYALAIARPFIWLAKKGAPDFIDRVVTGVSVPAAGFNRLLSLTQNGRLRLYLAIAAAGVVIFLAVGLLR